TSAGSRVRRSCNCTEWGRGAFSMSIQRMTRATRNKPVVEMSYHGEKKRRAGGVSPLLLRSQQGAYAPRSPSQSAEAPMRVGLLVWVVLFAGLARGADTPPLPKSHTLQKIEGWQVYVDDRLLASEDAALGRLSLGLLEGQLRIIALTVAEDRVKQLRQVS